MYNGNLSRCEKDIFPGIYLNIKIMLNGYQLEYRSNGEIFE